MILKWNLNTKYLKWNLEVNWQSFMWHVLIGRFGFGIYISDFAPVYNDMAWSQILSIGWGFEQEEGVMYPHLHYVEWSKISLWEIRHDELLRLGMSGLI